MQNFLGRVKKQMNIIQGSRECPAEFGHIIHFGDDITFDSVAYQGKRLLSFVMGSDNDIKVIDREDFYDLRIYHDNIYLFKETPKEKVTKLWYNIK